MDFIKFKNSLLLSIADDFKGLPNFGTISSKLSRSGQPTKAGFSYLKELGVDLILKLNTNQEFPLTQEQHHFEGQVIAHSIYEKEINKEYAMIAAFQIHKALKDGKKVHVHCCHGRDRTALAIGAYQIRYQNRSFENLQKDWKIYGEPRKEVQEILKKL